VTTLAPPNGTNGTNGTPPPPGHPVNNRPPHRPRHRLLTLLIVVLLIAVPGGYLVKSAFESRASGEDKQRNAAATNLTYGWPSKVQRDVYDVPLPSGSGHYAFYESNSWKTSSLYVQFRVPEKRLDDFLKDVGTDASKLRSGRVTIGDGHADRVGWNFHGDGHYAGTVVRQPHDRPDISVTVDREKGELTRVYIVSTVRF
jgi:hypothetical protein